MCKNKKKRAVSPFFPGIPRPNQAKEIEKPKLSETEKYWSNAKKSNFEYMEKDTMESVKVIVVGFGDRGAAYTKYALDNPDRLKVIAVVDPIHSEGNWQRKNLPLRRICFFRAWRTA